MWHRNIIFLSLPLVIVQLRITISLFCMCVCVAPGANGSVWEEAEGAQESVHWGRTVEASSGHEAGQRVETEHPQAEEERNEGAACSRCVGVFNTYNMIHYWSFLQSWDLHRVVKNLIHRNNFTIHSTNWKFKKTTNLHRSPGSVTRSIRSVRRWPRKSKRSPVRRSSWRPRSRVWEMCAAKRQRELR